MRHLLTRRAKAGAGQWGRSALWLLGALIVFCTGCGGPVPQSHDLLGIAASPWPVRNQALVVFLQPSADAVQVAELSKAVAAHKGVAAWQYDPKMTDAQERAALADWNPNGLMPAGMPPRFSRAFVVVARNGPDQIDLLTWLDSSPGVNSVAIWTTDFGSAVELLEPGPLP